MSFFDTMQATVFAVCSETFGDTATWEPAAGGAAVSAPVLFAAPSAERAALRGVHISDLKPEAEFYEGTFPGLAESLDEHEIERLTIRGTLYYVTKVEALADGKTKRATLLPDNGQ